MGESTISVTMFSSKLLVYPRVFLTVCWFTLEKPIEKNHGFVAPSHMDPEVHLQDIRLGSDG